MQYKIPQNVQIEDKIIGPLTMKQLVILGIGGSFTYLVYIILAKSFFIEIWGVPVAVLSLLTLTFTFVKIGGITFEKWILLFIEFQYNAKKRVFQMGAGDKNRPLGGLKPEKKLEDLDPLLQTKFARDKEKLQKISSISADLDTIKAK